MKEQEPDVPGEVAGLPRIQASDGRCPHCGSDKWVHLEGSKTRVQENPGRGGEEPVEVPAKYGCANCGGEFFVDEAMAWKRVKDIKRCPHCHSPHVIIAIKMRKGAVVACKHCNKLGLYERPGFEGQITVEDVKAVGRMTEEAIEFYGRRGFAFEVRRAKRQRKLTRQGGDDRP